MECPWGILARAPPLTPLGAHPERSHLEADVRRPDRRCSREDLEHVQPAAGFPAPSRS